MKAWREYYKSQQVFKNGGLVTSASEAVSSVPFTGEEWTNKSRRNLLPSMHSALSLSKRLASNSMPALDRLFGGAMSIDARIE